MDAITAHQHGYDNVVASMGTALTEHQVAEVLRITRRVTMALDADVAGQQATLRSLESSWQVFQNRQMGQARGTSLFQRQDDLNLRVAILSDGKDPDEVIRQSPARWEELVDKGVPLFDYLLPALSAQIDTATPEGKARMVEVVSPFIYAVREPIQQDSYVRKLADHLSVREETLQATLNRPAMRPGPARAPARTRPSDGPVTANGVDASAFAAADRDPMDEHCLSLLLRYPELASELPDAGGLPPEYFKRPENREIYLELTSAWSEMPEMLIPEDSLADQVKRNIVPELSDQVDHLAGMKLPPIESWLRPDELRQVIARMEERYLRELKLAEQARYSEDLSVVPDETALEPVILNRRFKVNQENRNQNYQKAIRGR